MAPLFPGRSLALTLAAAAGCRALGSLDDEVGLFQERAARHGLHGPPSGLGSMKAEEKPSDASIAVAEGAFAWSHSGLGAQRALREALLGLNSMNFLKNVEKVCLMAPSYSLRECGQGTAERLACPLVLRAATALVPMETLEAHLFHSKELASASPLGNGTKSAAQDLALASPLGNTTSALKEARSGGPARAAPVTVGACLQERRGKELFGLLGRFFAQPPVTTALGLACLGRRTNELGETCAEAEQKKLACGTIEHVALSVVGPVEMAKQMAFILGTHPIVIAKNRFDILDDPCKTRGAIALSIFLKFLMGMLAMVVLYCCVASVCCVLWKF